MITEEQIFNVLKKYGYYSLNRAPFVYRDKENLGIVFSWPNKHYGNLDRVIYIKTLEEAESEVYKYWWYMNNKDSANIDVLFDNYEISNPQVSYMYKSTALTIDIMKNFNEKEVIFVDPKENIKKRELLRTATILILVLKEKIRIQNEVYLKVTEMKEALKKLKEEYKTKLNLYKKGVNTEIETLDLLNDEESEVEALLKELHDKLLSLETIPDIKNFINVLYNYLVNIESSTSTIQNTYLLNRYTWEMEDITKKMNIVSDALNTKRRVFQTKQDVLDSLREVDNASQCRKMPDLKTYIENEKKQIIEKYQNRENIAENVLGDYLVDFENLDINIPPMIENNYYEEFNKEALYNNLKGTFESLTTEEKSACFVASSFLRECIMILIEKDILSDRNIKEIINKLILTNRIHIFNDAFMTLDHYENTQIRVKYFSIIKMKTFETFIKSLVEVVDILENLKITLKKSFYGYYIERDKSIVNLYLRNIIHLNKKTGYIARFMPNVPLYYSPVSIIRQLDIINNNELIERKNDTIFLMKDKVCIKEEDKKTIVATFAKNQVTYNNFTIVNSLKEKNKCTYYEDLIYNKDDGGIYE